MENNSFANSLKQLMDNYNKAKKVWLKTFKSDLGFDEWFTEQTSFIWKTL